MKLEINAKFAPTDSPIKMSNGGVVMVTPPLDEDYWLARVAFKRNALVCFPKFSTIGIGFQKEHDWNTNLPYTQPTDEIWNHIRHNKNDSSITPDLGKSAIKLLQDYARSLK